MSTVFSSPSTAGTLLVGTQVAPASVVTDTSDIIPTANGVYVCNPAGAITATGLQAGTVNGQEFTIINQSANTITMDVVGTSLVSNGATNVISALTAMTYIWSALDSLWYPTSIL